jgi:uncharacterized cofD-like protein
MHGWSVRNNQPRVVVVGGGTGSHAVLSGLRPLAVELACVVSVMDSGGSSGRLRDDYGFLPPGDARQCLVALAEDTRCTALLRSLFDYRFRSRQPAQRSRSARSLDGHNLGNLFISALSDITGSVEAAYEAAGGLLGVRGRVIPVTSSSVQLCARLTDGHVLVGEAAIDARREHLDAAIDYVFLDQPAYPTAAAVAVLREADLVVIGPGDLYTSIIPNLLVEGIAEAIAAARYRAFVVNLMTKRGETDGFRSSSFVECLLEYLAPATLDAALVNTAQAPDRIRQRYAAESAFPVEADVARIEAMGIKTVARSLASSRYFMRHDPVVLGQAVVEWFEEQQQQRDLAQVPAGREPQRLPIESRQRKPMNGRAHVSNAPAYR